MAVIIGETVSYPLAADSKDSVVLAEGVIYPLGADSKGSVAIAEASEFAVTSLTQLPAQTTVQKVWDTVAADWVLWETEGIDFNGGSYPGPGVWGAQTSDFRVQNVKYTRG